MTALVILLACLVAGATAAAVLGWRSARRYQRRCAAYQRILGLMPPTPPDGGLPGGGQPARLRLVRLSDAAA